MEFNNYMGKFTTSGEVQTAINNGDLVKPYVALVDGEIDWNSKSIDYSKMPLTFEILSGGTITWKATGDKYKTTLEYSKNGGEWTEITSSTSGTPITVSAGDTVQFRGNYQTGNNLFGDSTAKYNIQGNIMSLIDKDNFTTTTNLTTAIFYKLFSSAYYYRNTGLIDASKLVLPATTLATACYSSMFYGCTSLINAPVLPATTLATACYREMFRYCSSLTTAPELPATALTDGCYQGMFQYCTSLTTAPELPATTLAPICYNLMFDGCSNLSYIKCLATDISASGCTNQWVRNVSSTGTFVKNPSMTSWTTGINGIPTGWTIQDNV